MYDTFETTDIYLASFLSASGFYLYEIKQNLGKYVFCFEFVARTPEGKLSAANPKGMIEFNANQYHSGNAIVDPRRLFTEFKEIKARMYDFKRNDKK